MSSAACPSASRPMAPCDAQRLSEDLNVPCPEHEQFVAELIASGAAKVPDELPTPQDLVQVRAYERAQPAPALPGARIEQVQLGSCRALHVRPETSGARRMILYLHGGGYLFMTPEACAATMVALGRQCAAECMGLDYRRGPEDPFPAAVEDAVAAYVALLQQGWRAQDIILAGDSAGGGLALAALLAIAEAGHPRPAGAAVFSPWTDLHVRGASVDTVDDPNVSGRGLRQMAAAYLDGADPAHPHASPLYADEARLAQLPPILIQVGGREALRDDSTRFAEKAQRAGADVTLKVYPGVIHMWMVYAPQLPESKQSFELVAEFFARIQ